MTRLRIFAVAGALALLTPTAALAQAGWNAPGYREGFERGRRAGAEDARKGDRFDFTDESDYRRGDRGYNSRYGSRDRYRDVFRHGFEEGYRSGYGTFAQPRRGGYAYNPASQIGYNDGYEAGLDDGRDGRRYDPFGERRYRNADRGYERHYGPREVYKTHYRDAFKNGYARGYADGRRHDRRPIWGGIFGFRF